MRAFGLISFLLACSSATPPSPGADDDDTPPPDASPIGDAMADGPVQKPRFLCSAEPPAGAPQPTLPPLPAAGCPVLAPGLNTIQTGHGARQFLLVVPESIAEGEKLPVLFMWHWLGGDAEDFRDKGDVQTAADDQHFLSVLPVSKGATILGTSFNTRWPFDITQSQARMTEELEFFDGMLACVQQQYTTNTSCVSSVGVSAGALWNAQLAQARSTVLASFVSLSGGTGATWIKNWNGATRKLPAVVLWGGDGSPEMDGNKDILGCFGIGMDFSVASRSLEDGLAEDGHFFVECRHNCGHVEPPLTPPPGESKYAGMWEFALDHPFWLAAGQSPYLTDGLPAGMPAWCAIGAGNSIPRSGGGCPEAENPCSQ
jgi:predicted esterase